MFCVVTFGGTDVLCSDILGAQMFCVLTFGGTDVLCSDIWGHRCSVL